MGTTATFTELLRHPNDVAARTGDGAVRIIRRDAEDLILIRADDLTRQRRGIALTSRLMRATLRYHGAVGDAVGDTFGWVEALSEQERTEFVAEIESLVWSAAELGEYTRILNTVQSWEATAQAYLAGAAAQAADDPPVHSEDAGAVVAVADYPQLQMISWQLRPDAELTEREALSRYERNWRHVDTAALTDDERRFIDHLANTYGGGRLLV